MAELIRRQFQVRYRGDHVGRPLRGLGFTRQKPERQARERDEAAEPVLGGNGVAASKKGALRLKATLVFLDEGGLIMAPLVRRTWAPRGQTPVLLRRTRPPEEGVGGRRPHRLFPSSVRGVVCHSAGERQRQCRARGRVPARARGISAVR